MLCATVGGASARASSSSGAAAGPITHTRQPICVGGSVVAVKYAGGVMTITDTLVSYGRMARYKDMQRVHAVANNSLVAAGGEHSDFQAIVHMLEDLEMDDRNADDGYKLEASHLYHYLRTVMYNRRNKMNPLYNDVVVGGLKDGEPFLGTVDPIGTQYEEDFIATGFGGYLVTPILRSRWRADMDEGEARALLEDCMRVLFYRHCTALNRVHLAKVTADGAVISPPFVLQNMNWSFRSFIEPKSTEGDW